ncbi:HlyD family efflux transporter periplasmic adaptor subunit [Alicyclobacillaceae bacterium I2511]|nr:HlyD family efflux transporter periplasmic adaptor subunit [Alicyclobacillaceae bacterium I2511]
MSSLQIKKGKRSLMRVSRIILINLVGFIVVLLAIAGGGWYFYNQNNYVSVSDASVQAKQQYIAAVAAGKLTKWSVQQGTAVQAGDVLGVEQLATGQTLNITSPIKGQVVKSDAVVNEVVGPGTLLGAVMDIQNEYITANIRETAIRNVQPGQRVDVYIDAYPGNTFPGVVHSICSETAAESLGVPSDSSGTFTKEVQRMPVRISLNTMDGKYVVPGMNASVRIHRNNL